MFYLEGRFAPYPEVLFLPQKKYSKKLFAVTTKLKNRPFVCSDLNSLAPLFQTKILAYDKNSFFLTLIRQGEKKETKILAYNKILYLTLIRQGEIFTFHSINYFFINRKRALRPLPRSTFFTAKKVLKKTLRCDY